MEDINWNEVYKLAKQYYEDNGNLSIPDKYEIKGIKLGRWIYTQRNYYKKNKLSKDKIDLLENIGIVWNPYETQWYECYNLSVKYYKENGNLLIAATYTTEDNKQLGMWISRQRKLYKDNKLSKEKIELLEKINMVWDPFDSQWYSFYNLAIEYYKKNGDLLIPLDYKTIDDVNLGSWIGKQRQNYKDNKLSKEKIELLEKINMVWDPFDSQWKDFYNSLVNYYKENGNSNVPLRYITKEGKKLGYWVGTQRSYYKDDKLSKEKIELLEKVEMVWDPASMTWNETYEIAKMYFKENGNLNIPNKFFYKNVNLGSWILTQRNNYNQKILNDNQIELLNKIGMEWDSIRSRDYIWEHNYNIIVEFYNKYKHLYIPTNYIASDGTNIGMWLFEQKTKYNNNALSEDRKHKLDLLDKTWLEPSNTKSSFPEYAVLYYINKYFPTATKLKNKKISEIDIYIPELKVGIEYDGPTHIKSVKKDIEKSKVCEKQGIKLIRIRDCECPILNDNSYKIILENDSFEALDDAIIKLLKYLNISNNVNVDIKRDYIEISDNYIKSIDLDWYNMYEKLEDYYNQHGNINVPIYYKTSDGFSLGHWVSSIRNSIRNPNLKGMRLNSNKIDLLNKLGMDWEPFETQWNMIYELAKQYYEENGDLLIPDKYEIKGIKLGRWISTQRNSYKENTLSKEKISLLEKIGMIWNVIDYQWMKMYDLSVNYYNKNGNLLIPNDFKTSDNTCLGSWIGKQRKHYRQQTLSKERIDLLNKIGMVWNPRKEK